MENYLPRARVELLVSRKLPAEQLPAIMLPNPGRSRMDQTAAVAPARSLRMAMLQSPRLLATPQRRVPLHDLYIGAQLDGVY